MELANGRFLLDENIPTKLKRCFPERGLDCSTVKDVGLNGRDDRDISTKIHEQNLILVTRDKHFTFFWKKRSLKVIYIAIEPAILETIEPRVADLLDTWTYQIENPFLIILQVDTVRIWQSSKRHLFFWPRS